jgi:putative membrane protein
MSPGRRRLAAILGTGPVPPGAGRGGGEGVRTRDHLANSRTFLAWMRLALTLVAAGLSIDKLDVLLSLTHGHSDAGAGDNHGAALALVVAGGVLANLAFARFLLQRRVIEGPALRSRVLLDATLIGIAGVTGVLMTLLVLRTR